MARAERARGCALQFTQATVGNSVPLERHSRSASQVGRRPPASTHCETKLAQSLSGDDQYSGFACSAHASA